MIDYKSQGNRWKNKNKRSARTSSTAKVRQVKPPSFQRQTQNKKMANEREPRVSANLSELPSLLPRVLFGFVVLWLALGLVREGVSLYRAPLERVVISGLEKLTAKQLVAAMGLKEGISLSQIAPLQIADAAMNLPQIKQVSVRRLFPGGIQIGVKERKPYGVVSNGVDQHALITKEGILLEPYPAQSLDNSGYPILLVNEFQGPYGNKLNQIEVLVAIELIEELDSNPLYTTTKLKIDLRKPQEIKLILPGEKHDVLLPRLPTKILLERLRLAENILRAENKNFAGKMVVDLRAGDDAQGGRIVFATAR